MMVQMLEDIVIKSQPIFGKRGYSIGHYAQVARADLLVMNAPAKMTFWDRLFPHDIEHILTEREPASSDPRIGPRNLAF